MPPPPQAVSGVSSMKGTELGSRIHVKPPSLSVNTEYSVHNVANPRSR